jgi:hypothetical protein
MRIVLAQLPPASPTPPVVAAGTVLAPVLAGSEVASTPQRQMQALRRGLVVPRPVPEPPRMPERYAVTHQGSLLLGFMETIGISLVAGAGFAQFQARRLRLL